MIVSLLAFKNWVFFIHLLGLIPESQILVQVRVVHVTGGGGRLVP